MLPPDECGAPADLRAWTVTELLRAVLGLSTLTKKQLRIKIIHKNSIGGKAFLVMLLLLQRFVISFKNMLQWICFTHIVLKVFWCFRRQFLYLKEENICRNTLIKLLAFCVLKHFLNMYIYITVRLTLSFCTNPVMNGFFKLQFFLLQEQKSKQKYTL